MQTPAQVAKQAHVTAQTIRNYSAEYADLLSSAASRTNGPRLYTDEDVRVLCTIAGLLRSGVARHEISERIRKQDVPPIIDITPQTPSIEPQMPAQETALMAQMVLNNHQSRIEALERSMVAQRRDTIRAAEIRGAAWALGAGAIFLWALYLLGG